MHSRPEILHNKLENKQKTGKQYTTDQKLDENSDCPILAFTNVTKHRGSMHNRLEYIRKRLKNAQQVRKVQKKTEIVHNRPDIFSKSSADHHDTRASNKASKKRHSSPKIGHNRPENAQQGGKEHTRLKNSAQQATNW